jgi:two-component system sensor histidine kinase KdpD
MNGDGRPDPEDLLRRYRLAMRDQVQRRGRLRVLLGAAPGVGKSYSMLAEGHRLKREGRDVVIGLVETHGRAETADQIEDLEIVPMKTITYQGVELAEMDTDAILRRAPEIVLVDELAHTNVPGSARSKRWQDVEAIRDAGIDVIATLNIQHLESLNHIVEGITGVKVRETIPDQVLSSATDVQLVDLSVEGLVERLEAGKIYPPERANQALQHFFRAGNLTALRELALRYTAADVDERLEHYMHEQGIAAVWPAAEKVAVLVGERPAGTLLRAAWRLASVLRSELIALVVMTPDGSPAKDSDGRALLDRNLQLAEDLGAVTRTLDGDSTAAAVANFLHDENIGFLVLGHDAAKRPRLFGKSLVDQIFALVDNVNIQLVEERGTSAQ